MNVVLLFISLSHIRYAKELATLTALQETSEALSLQVVACEERASRCETNLRVEREWRCDLQDKEQKAKEYNASLQIQIKQLHDEIKGFDRMRNELERFQKQWAEAQITLEELGIQLSVSKLQVSELQEKAKTTDARLLSSESNGSIWTPDNATSKCKKCERQFSLTRRKVSLKMFKCSLEKFPISLFSFLYPSIIVGIAVKFTAATVRNK